MMSQDSTFFILGLEIRETGVENVTEDKNRTQLHWNLISHAHFPRNEKQSFRKGKESPMQQGCTAPWKGLNMPGYQMGCKDKRTTGKK